MFMNFFIHYMDVINSEKRVMFLAVSRLPNSKQQQQKKKWTLCLCQPECL